MCVDWLHVGWLLTEPVPVAAGSFSVVPAEPLTVRLLPYVTESLSADTQTAECCFAQAAVLSSVKW